MVEQFYLKIHESYRSTVSLCDADLLGKRFEEGKMQLDVRESFFKGEEASHEEVVRVLQAQIQEDATFYIIGEKSVELAKKAEVITQDHVGVVDGIPFALVLL